MSDWLHSLPVLWMAILVFGRPPVGRLLDSAGGASVSA